jgi:S1-C subfamily serine protease
VVAVDGLPVRGIDDLLRLLTADRIGRRCEVEIVRDGASRRVTLVPRELTA